METIRHRVQGNEVATVGSIRKRLAPLRRCTMESLQGGDLFPDHVQAPKTTMPVNQFGRVVLDYHGCLVDHPEAVEFIRGMIAGTNYVNEWSPGNNE